jgi:hypothetical protein
MRVGKNVVDIRSKHVGLQHEGEAKRLPESLETMQSTNGARTRSCAQHRKLLGSLDCTRKQQPQKQQTGHAAQLAAAKRSLVAQLAAASYKQLLKGWRATLEQEMTRASVGQLRIAATPSAELDKKRSPCWVPVKKSKDDRRSHTQKVMRSVVSQLARGASPNCIAAAVRL